MTMHNNPRVLMSIGTRPEVIKMAPLYFALKSHGIHPVLLHTGQHNEMASSLYELFDIVPDYNLILGRASLGSKESEQRPQCDLSMQSSALLQNVSSTMMEVDPAIVFVHGDTSSALMSAMAAFYQKRPIAHIEAGLRSRNEYNPFPEEKNRVLIAQLARWHFAPAERAKQNLLAEGVPETNIHVVGNTVVEAAQLGIKKLEARKPSAGADASFALIDTLSPQLEGKKILMVTMHRRENHGANILSAVRAVVALMEKYKEMLVVWPVHPNPKVKEAVHEALKNISAELAARLYLTDPLSYPAMLWILKNSWLVLTDSGGIQEEAVALNTPMLVLRNTTERPEVIEVGAGMLVGTNKDNIIQQVEALYLQPERYEAMKKAKNPYGNGTTAARICDVLIRENFLEKKHA